MTGLASRGQLRASLFRWALFTVPLVLLLGFLSGRVGSNADSPWFQSLVKPDIFPPPMWFGIVWSILYVLMGIALAIVCAALKTSASGTPQASSTLSGVHFMTSSRTLSMP